MHVEGVEKKCVFVYVEGVERVHVHVLRMCGGGGEGVCACGGGGLLAHDNDRFIACRVLTIDNQLIQVYSQFRYRQSPNSHFMSCNETYSQHVTVTASLKYVCGWR